MSAYASYTWRPSLSTSGPSDGVTRSQSDARPCAAASAPPTSAPGSSCQEDLRESLNGAPHPALPQSITDALSDLAYHLIVTYGLCFRLVTRRGDDVLIRATPRSAADSSRLDALTAAELRVARLVARGATNREVAEWLSLCSKTVEAHLSRIYRKLDVRSRAGVAFLLGRVER